MKFTYQKDAMDCGPACLSMIASYYKKRYPLEYLREHCFLTREGVSLQGLTEAAGTIGLQTVPVKLSVEKLLEESHLLPCILHWNQEHFVVLRKICMPWYAPIAKIFQLSPPSPRWSLADPAYGYIKVSNESFVEQWASDDRRGVALFLEPTSEFYKIELPAVPKLGLKFITGHLMPYRRQLISMFLLLLLGSGLTLVFPFLMQHLIDRGVAKKDLPYIGMILTAQLVLYLGSIIIEIARNWIMLFVGTKISITIISEFLKKLLRLPIKFFDTKLMGDFNQRIQDNERIENFLTSQSLLTFFSIITFSVFFGVLCYYDYKILLSYLAMTAIALAWSFYWLKKRKILDYLRFQRRSENQESIYEIISGVAEMKLNQFEEFKRKEWESIQYKLFGINVRVLRIDQIQMSGFDFINQVKNILVTFLAASFVIQGRMTLGELLSVSYIVGQMNAPVSQLLNFFRSLQDAKLSLERLNEVQNSPAEEENGKLLLEDYHSGPGEKFNVVKHDGIIARNLSFQYEGPKSLRILNDINFVLPKGKITAIVGSSGSGKTTLMKLLLKFYEPTAGSLFFGDANVKDISSASLRAACGTVMQDGFIFSDSIERNIATGDETIDRERLQNAVKIANVEEFIECLPLGYKTKIGASGIGISGGQKQRILIARAVYKNPRYIFLDEATSALDAENEKIIHENLLQFFQGKTVLVIAHRLSTVKSADQIIVLKNGSIVEQGSHAVLVNKKGDYYNLIKNQLELGI